VPEYTKVATITIAPPSTKRYEILKCSTHIAMHVDVMIDIDVANLP
jgi:hypothetical protein